MKAADARKAANRGYWWTVAIGSFAASGGLIAISDDWFLAVLFGLGGLAAIICGYRGTERGSSGRGDDVSF